MISSRIGDLAGWLFSQWQRLPQGVRLLIRDVLEAMAAAIATLNIAMPADVEAAKRLGVTVVFALAAAAIAVIRRYAWQWLLDHVAAPDPAPVAPPAA